ncbi:MAG: MFS transporter [Myxococcales bacterium]|nr:MFS transporter [Myxococcales bacterium]
MLGTMIGGAAMSFTAILVLQASPSQVALLATMDMAPGLLIGLHVGAWVDRLRRRPLLIATDIGRFLLLLTVPAAALLGVLHMQQLYLVAFCVSLLSVFFNVSYQAYLPSLIDRDQLLEGNSKLAAGAAVAEFSGFGLAGWLVHLLTAPFAVLIDALSFLFSALAIRGIRAPESMPEHAGSPAPILQDIIAGVREVVQQPLLRALAVCNLGMDVAGGIFAALVVLYMSRGLGFSPAVLTPIWAVGGFASLLGAVYAGRLTARLGMGPALIAGVLGTGVGMLFIPAASGATLLAAGLLIAQQLVGDAAATLFEINQSTLRQRLAPAAMLGRISATLDLGKRAATLAGTLLGGVLGTVIGVRQTLMIAAVTTLLSALWLALSPLRRLRQP